jgi:hypothetical protein
LQKFKELDDKIVIFGMSCSGKTTFAKTLKYHKYICFDEHFQWHLIETLGLSIEANLNHIKKLCNQTKQKYVLDGWHLADRSGDYLPEDSYVYVVWAPYEKITSQYRIPVTDPEEFRSMYTKWYCEVDYQKFPKIRYFENKQDFIEISSNQFFTYLQHNQ